MMVSVKDMRKVHAVISRRNAPVTAHSDGPHCPFDVVSGDRDVKARIAPVGRYLAIFDQGSVTDAMLASRLNSCLQT